MRNILTAPLDQIPSRGEFVSVKWAECVHGIIKDASKPCDHKGKSYYGRHRANREVDSASRIDCTVEGFKWLMTGWHKAD